jgi:hypothetical protein
MRNDAGMPAVELLPPPTTRYAHALEQQRRERLRGDAANPFPDWWLRAHTHNRASVSNAPTAVRRFIEHAWGNIYERAIIVLRETARRAAAIRVAAAALLALAAALIRHATRLDAGEVTAERDPVRTPRLRHAEMLTLTTPRRGPDVSRALLPSGVRAA